MSKGYDLKKLISNWKREGTLEEKSQVLSKIPKECIDCKNEKFEFWGETEEEIVFRCIKCRRYYSIPFKSEDLRFYFTY